MSLKYVPKDYNPRLTATQEQIDVCNDRLIRGRMNFKDDKGKNQWFNQCLKREQGVSSLAGKEAKEEWEAQQEDNTKTAGFGSIPKIVWILVGVGALYFVAKKQKWIK